MGEEKSLGTLLKETRVIKGISLERASIETRLSKKYLEALENDNYAIFPAYVYFKGYVLTYARYLGLPEEEILLYVDKWAVSFKRISPVPRVKKYKMQSYLTGSICVLIVFVIFMLISKKKNELKSFITVGTTRAPLSVENGSLDVLFSTFSDVNVVDTSSQVKKNFVNETGKDDYNILEVKCLANTWARLVVNGMIIYQGTLVNGITYVWKSKKKMTLVVNFPKNVEVRYNSRLVDVSKNIKGDSATLVFPEE